MKTGAIFVCAVHSVYALNLGEVGEFGADREFFEFGSTKLLR